MTPEEQVDRTITLWAGSSSWDILDEEGRFFGIVQKKRHLFLPGDIVIGFFSNGGGRRWPVYARSSRGYDVAYFYLEFQRWDYDSPKMRRAWARKEDPRTQTYTDRTQARLLVTPDPLRLLPATDPALRAWLVSEASRACRTPVSADSGVSSDTNETVIISKGTP